MDFKKYTIVKYYLFKEDPTIIKRPGVIQEPHNLHMQLSMHRSDKTDAYNLDIPNSRTCLGPSPLLNLLAI